VRCLFRLPYRQTQGVLLGISSKVPELGAPCYTQIMRRFNKLPVLIKLKENSKPLWIAVDASGISVTNRGEWMRKIHRKGKIGECKGFLKIHVAVDVRTKELVSVEVTRENVGDNPMLEPLLIQTVQNTGKKIKRLLADGGYDSYQNFEMCKESGIEPVIRIDDNAVTAPPPQDFIHRNRPEPVRTTHAREQLSDREKWKKNKKYGLRWIVETFFSVLKRRFGTYTSARKYKNMQHELCFKAQLYNQLL
ncbi:MAG: IS5 family transposase, partial [Nanoarchaeota archaeon]